MPTILLVRHAENDYLKQGRLPGRLPGVHLNEAGRQQAQATASLLKQRQADAPVKAVYSSPMERALETAEAIAQALGLQVLPRLGLIETEIGELTGKTIKSLRRRKLWKAVQETPAQFRFPGGESFAECQQRIVAEIDALRAGLGEKDTIICISHADPIKLAIAHYLGMPLDCFQRLSVATTSISALSLSDQGVRLLSLNYIPIPHKSAPG